MRVYWGLLHNIFLALLSLSIATPKAFAKFEQTTSPKVDNKAFGGMSDEELEKLSDSLQADYLSAVKKNIEQFNLGDKSSAVGGNGRYGGFGEAHISKGDAMVSHEGGSNAAEGAVEEGALGSVGLSGEARIKKEKEIMEANTKPEEVTDKDGNKTTKYRNALTRQLQDKTFEISAALYDAGSAHGDANDPHRVYGLKNEVRTKSEKNGAEYSRKTIADATLAPGKQPNLDLLHKSFSKMEQDKYIMMASDAFAFKSARLDETDTTDHKTKNTIAEYKQLAVDEYAKHPGDIQAAEKAIQSKMALRVAEKKIVGSKKLCSDGSVGDCSKVQKQASNGEPPKVSLDKMSEKLLQDMGAEVTAANKEFIKDKIKHRFEGEGGKLEEKPIASEDLMGNFAVRDLSGLLNTQKLTEKYAQAKQSLDPEEQAKIGQYEQRLKSNDCISFQGFCYVKAFAPEDKNKKEETAANPNAKGIDKDDPNEFQKVSGDPGAHFRDTREFIFSKFAYAYNRPLAEWDSIIGSISADFSEATDQKLKTGSFEKGQDGKVRDGKLYKEYKDMHRYAMEQAQNIKKNADQNLIDRLRSAGASDEQISKIKANYSTKFDPTKLTHMQLFGQNKDRDAIMMEWRKHPQSKITNPNYRPRLTSAPARKSPLSNVQSSSGTPNFTGPI